MSKYILMTFLYFVNAQTSIASDNESHKGHDHNKKEHKVHKKQDAHNHEAEDLLAKKKDHKGHDEHPEHKEHGDHSDHKEHDDHSEHKEQGEHKGHDDHSSKAVGKGKAIEVVDDKKGFKLSPEAIKTLKLKLQNVDGSEFLIEKSTLVVSKELKGLYRFRGGFFKFHPVELKKEINGKYLVKVPGVEFGDQIVVNGTGLLRVADVYSTDTSEYGHSH